MPSPHNSSPSDAFIYFHNEDIDFDLPQSEEIKAWILATTKLEHNQIASLNYIFCTDPYLHKINVEYLNHDTFTDVITFPYHENPIEGDIFISIDRIRENALTFGVDFLHELHRVMIHGLLHLLGYGDKTPEEKKNMTAKEEEYLHLLNGMILDTNGNS